MSRRVLVTGAGGKTGRAVIGALLERGAAVRALVRDPGRLGPLADRRGVEVVVGDQRDTGHLAAAATGCDAVEAIAPNMSPDEVRMGRAVVEACHRAGVARLVFHSVIHPQLTAMAHHADKGRVEELVVGSGLAWTIVQPNAYLQNLAGHADELRAGRYPVPYATDRASAMVDLRDVVEVTARCLVDDVGVHATFELSGPEPVTAEDVARVAGEVLGRPVVATRLDPAAWEADNATLPEPMRTRLAAMFRHYDHHGSPGDATVLACLLGRAPRGLAAFLRELFGG